MSLKLQISLMIVLLDATISGYEAQNKNTLAKKLGVSLKDGDFKKFYDFMVKFEKTYDGEEEERKRFGYFKNNLKGIDKLNAAEMGTALYGITDFTDQSEDELKDWANEIKRRKVSQNPEKIRFLLDCARKPDIFSKKEIARLMGVPANNEDFVTFYNILMQYKKKFERYSSQKSKSSKNLEKVTGKPRVNTK